MMLNELRSKNGTHDDWWPVYYRYFKNDLNGTQTNDKKYQRKQARLDLRLKSKRRKQQNTQTNSVLPNENFDVSTSKSETTSAITTNTTTILPTTSIFTVETTTAAITTSTNTPESSVHESNTTSEIHSIAQINDRMSLNETTTIKTDTIPTITTEHSITYNVTANNPKDIRIANRTKPKKLSNAIWGKWQKWTKCSRSCGGGVMSQSRHCLYR